MEVNVSDQKCLLCDQPAKIDKSAGFNRNVVFVKCPQCGGYGVTDEAQRFSLSSLSQVERDKVTSFLRERQLRGLPDVVLTHGRVAPGVPDFKSAVVVEDAIAEFPKTVGERLDRILTNISLLGPVPGSWVDLHEEHVPLTYAESGDAFTFVIGALIDGGFLDGNLHSDGAKVRLSPAGWQRVTDIESGTVAQPKQAFVGMSFGSPHRGSVEAGIVEGISKAGYAPWIADRVEHVEKIDDRIVAEIRRSAFVVADLTGHRQNVYYEAGFAAALGKRVIYTCAEAEKEPPHFDLRQFNILIWKDQADLAERLRYRIEAVIGAPRG